MAVGRFHFSLAGRASTAMTTAAGAGLRCPEKDEPQPLEQADSRKSRIMRVDKVLEKLAKTDKVTVSLEALPDGKIRANTSAWGDAMLEVRAIDGQLRLARKERFHDDGDLPVEAYDPYGPGVTALETERVPS
jgi:hypothetical protein